MNTKLASGFLALLCSTTFISADPFAEIVRTTEPLTPADEQKTFHLPPGFKIQLVASEPEFIGKPINMAWDAKGRLWATISREYPFPVALDQKGRDVVKIFEDFDPETGRARKVSTFVEGLNIPIGLYPYKNGVLVFSIPNVYYFQDTDGDGRADKSEIVMGKYGFDKDTHGLTGSFRRGYDGWLYADHGFHNDSTLTAKDGSEIKLNSGNVYRMKIDGSHVEQFTWGQVNPFGLCFDPLGDLWSTDCHSSPVYMLLRGGYYPSFGKPHDGLGFAPNICEHSHGSTAIAGSVFYAATNFPVEFQNNIFIGNVMTSRINRDSLIEKDSTRIAKEQPDFMSCDDPWFRPVDLQLGPDGAMYVADFYNRIIGHYEVPLTHPGRDRERGRIWRIVYVGTNTPANTAKTSPNQFALPKDAKGLVAELASSNVTRRMLAMNELVDNHGKEAIKTVESTLKSGRANSFQKAHALWVLHRLGALDEKLLESASKDHSRTVRVHAMRVLSETKDWSPRLHKCALEGLLDSDPYAQRAAADALGLHSAAKNISPLIALRNHASRDDAQLIHVVRMSLRNNLTNSQVFSEFLATDLPEADSRTVADVAIGIKTAEAGQFLLKHILKFSEDRQKMADYLRHAARYAPESNMDQLAKFTREKVADDLDLQLALFKSVQEGLQQRGAKMSDALVEWGTELAEHLLASVDPKSLDWRNSPIKNNDTTNPWTLQERRCADGQTTTVISSLAPGGESYTGILRSKAFVVPAKLSFYLCGHDGSPEKPPRKKNFVRLRSAENNKVLMEVVPPRDDTAHLITWDLKKHEGKKAFLEIVDGNTGRSYAWLGIGRITPEVVPFPKVIPNQVDKRQLSAAELAESLKLKKLEPQLAELVKNGNADVDARGAAAKALIALNPTAHIGDLAAILTDADEPMKLREKCAAALAQVSSAEANAALVQTLGAAPHGFQTQIALALASNAEGAETLLKAAESGKTAPHFLQATSVKDRLIAAKPANVKERLEKLTKDLTPISEEKQKLIDARRGGFNPNEASAENGAKVFTQSCAVCHSMDGKGANVGPQLDGVGTRGADRLIEDILDPNRNVDAAFHYSNVTLKDDQVITGLFRREEGELLVFADSTGKEVKVAKKDISERRESQNSLMPDNFSDALPEQDFYDLIAYLMSKSAKK